MSIIFAAFEIILQDEEMYLLSKQIRTQVKV
jgi:hypothetical protein